MRQPSDTPGQKLPVLNSWKEIAAYLSRGVRTVQRWERDLHMPVHRPKGKDRSAVIAFPEELDRWLHAAPTRFPEAMNVSEGPTLLTTRIVGMQKLSNTGNDLMVRVSEVAKQQTHRAREIREKVQALRKKCGGSADGQAVRKIAPNAAERKPAV